MERTERQKILDYCKFHGQTCVMIGRTVKDPQGSEAVVVRMKDVAGRWVTALLMRDIQGDWSEIDGVPIADEERLIRDFVEGRWNGE